MIDEKIKNIINKLEKILKKDIRYKTNGDDNYRNHIKKIYEESQYAKKPIDLTNLVNFNNKYNKKNIDIDIEYIEDMKYLNSLNNMLIQINNTLNKLINN